MTRFDATEERGRLGLAADCSSCFGVCCVAPAFRASALFAIDKPYGQPCPNLLMDFGCGIHQTLRQQGFSGCTAYTCFGAGQKISQKTFRGTDWRQAPQTAEMMFQTLPIMRQLHEFLWFITEALELCATGPEHDELLGVLDETERLTTVPADQMSWSDVDRHCRVGETLLRRVSMTVRVAALSADSDELGVGPDAGRQWGGSGPGDSPRGPDLQSADLQGADLQGADLSGANLQGADLRGADLWGAVLINADLRSADLRWADLMGTNLGQANLAGTDLSAAIFLTQSQIQLARGDADTCISRPLSAPGHWPGAAAN